MLEINLLRARLPFTRYSNTPRTCGTPAQSTSPETNHVGNGAYTPASDASVSLTETDLRDGSDFTVTVACNNGYQSPNPANTAVALNTPVATSGSPYTWAPLCLADCLTLVNDGSVVIVTETTPLSHRLQW